MDELQHRLMGKFPRWKCLEMEKANSILDFPGHVIGDADSFRKRSLD